MPRHTHIRPNLAIVLGADVNGLGHVRSLGTAGVPVTVVTADGNLINPACSSRYCRIVYTAEPANDDSAIMSILDAIGSESSVPPVLFATSDSFVDFISRHRQELCQKFLFNIPDDHTLRALSNKRESHVLATKFGIAAPRTIDLATFRHDEVDEVVLKYPCIIKPQDSFSIEFPWKNRLVKSNAELTTFLMESPLLSKHAILQELIPGGEGNIFQCTAYLGRNVEPQYCVVQKLHQFPPNYGTTTLGRTCSMPQLQDMTTRLLHLMKYSGFASVEYKRSDVDERFYFVEINPRLPWYNSLFQASGVNFPLLQYLDLTQSVPANMSELRSADGVYWLHLRNEVAGVVRRWRCGESMRLGRWMLYVLRARSFAHFDLQDPVPFFRAYGSYLRTAISRVLHGVRLRTAKRKRLGTTEDQSSLNERRPEQEADQCR